MKWTFALKDKGTSNEGWWLKITNIEELCVYHEVVVTDRNDDAFRNKLYDKHELPLTTAITQYAERNRQSFVEALMNLNLVVAQNQLRDLLECGAIYINRVGGYHGAYEKDPQLDTVTTEGDRPVFPSDDYVLGAELPKEEKPIKKYEYGWLSPTGDFYTAPWGTHEEKAQEICTEMGIDATDEEIIKYGSRHTLSKRGWLLLHDPTNNGKIFVTSNGLEERDPTKRQRDFLYGYFMDRGMTQQAEAHIKDSDYDR